MALSAPITELVFSDGQRLPLEHDSIVVFVGPNNAGKTTCLRDIYECLAGEGPGLIVQEVAFQKPEISDIASLFDEVACESLDYSDGFVGMNFKVHRFDMDRYSSRESYPDSIRNALFSFLTTESRLSACSPSRSISREDPADGPISFLVKDSGYLEKVSNLFSDAFGQEVTPFYQYGPEVPLCLGPQPELPEKMKAPEVNDYLYQTLGSYPKAHLQGDGVRSYLGIALYLFLQQYSALFVDEPESFLHPPQAMSMGRALGSSGVVANQLFISTHSKDLLNGLLGACPQRVKIVRITRSGDTNEISLLESQDVKELVSTTLLKYTDVMNALFHERTVLCESDSDCMFYQAVWDSVYGAGSSSPLFLPVGGKARFKVFAKLLAKLSVDYIVVADADILRDPGDFKELLSLAGGDWNAVKDDWTRIRGRFDQTKKQLTASGLKSDIAAVLDGVSENEVPREVIRKIRGLLDASSGWDDLKRFGARSLTGLSYDGYERIDKYFIEHRIHVVPVGELEGFIPSIEDHGPSWASEVLQRYSDLGSEVYRGARRFVSSWWPNQP